jgi:hypothetical protein
MGTAGQPRPSVSERIKRSLGRWARCWGRCRRLSDDLTAMGERVVAGVLGPDCGEADGMSVAPSPDQIYQRATAEGRRRLSLSILDQVSTGFIAGVTIIFGL